ncbi:DNA replication/repair protein RecF [Sediminivirga luteola]|uniref:DNA replication and repair protein RecF n=1 Tax=Sediminivirga luteola TaxID=1774748 RepID=A0A8J2XL61_9MICO|nr:DNA replication/repair protein RecF [Sediminivirga luteola]MCI2266630.1 DNA replication/repair protein RecF [Sediminivirga luteola]GGA20164.1 DNA replication and repair protein RecF [Sediminivirga luteola]
MYVGRLSLQSFRSYPNLDMALEPGITTLVAPNGVGKTNLIEAIGYLSVLGSHRVSSDAPLITVGKETALVRAQVLRASRQAVLEVSINAKGANKARINRVEARPRELLGLLSTVIFAPEDLSIVKGDPGERRRFLDGLLVSRRPRLAGVMRDYEKALRQRNALLKSARGQRWTDTHETTLSVWDDTLARAGGQIIASRLALIEELTAPLREAYGQISGASQEHRRGIAMSYSSPVADAAGGVSARGTGLPDVTAGAGAGPATGSAAEAPSEQPAVPDTAQAAEARTSPGGARNAAQELAEALKAEYARLRRAERERGLTLAGPHRDDVDLRVGETPVKGFASHGESWSFALGLKLAAWELHKADSPDPHDWPVLILDDVFAELDRHRRARLAALVADAEQLLITAAVEEDLPEELGGRRVQVIPGGVADA